MGGTRSSRKPPNYQICLLLPHIALKEWSSLVHPQHHFEPWPFHIYQSLTMPHDCHCRGVGDLILVYKRITALASHTSRVAELIEQVGGIE